MKKIVKYLITISCVFLLIMPGWAQSFIHPGIDMNKDDLEYMKNQVLDGKEPWKKSFELLKEGISLDFQFEPYPHVISGPYAKPDVGGNELSRCSRMAYSCAILWYITKDERYAEKVIEIIDKWSVTLRSFDENNAKLLVALTGYEFCNAAEILRYSYSKWTDKNTESMTRLMMSAYYPVIRYYFSEANGNWDGAIMHTLMSIAVFTDNRALFDNAVYHFLHAPANGSLIKYIYPNGQCQETARDQGHVQMGLYEFSGAARVAYTQGVDLFSAADNRLALGLEYSAKYVTGGTVFAYGVPSERERYKYRSGFEYCLDLYTSKGIDMPNLRELCSRTLLDNATNALWKLTSYCVEFRKKATSLRKLEPSNIAYPTGAKSENATANMKNIVIIQSNQDLQTVVDSYAGSGKTLLLRTGEYKLKEALRIPSGVHLCGEGLSTVILCEPSVRTAAILLKDVDAHTITIENLVLDGAWSHTVDSDPNTGRFNRTGRLSNSLTGISFRGEIGHGLRDIRLKNLTVINFSRSGVYISDVKGLEIEDCNFSDNGAQVVPGPRLQHNLFIHHSTGVHIKNSRFDTSLRGCGIVADHCRDVHIDKCEIARNGWHGVMMAECQNGVVEHCLIEGNNGCGFMGEFLYNGSKSIAVKNNKIQYNNDYAVKSFSIVDFIVNDNTYRWNGMKEKQEFISSKKEVQLEGLSNN